MSLLDQAKKEAKRLFTLAKNQSINSTNITLNFENLSSSKEYIAIMNGYKNWHDYEENLKRKDLVLGHVDKNKEYKNYHHILENKQYYIQDIIPHEIQVLSNQSQAHIIIDKAHQPIIMGKQRGKKGLFESKEKKPWLLNQYPMSITASTGAGKSEVLLSMASQYIANHEGVIYMEGKGDSVIYSKMFSYCKKYNRLNDLFCLNFFPTASKETSNNLIQNSHSIDPINPMAEFKDYFISNFGEKIGEVIHFILNCLKIKNQVMDIHTLESILMLQNLITWTKENTFGENTVIHDYINHLDLNMNDSLSELSECQLDEALEKHALICARAYEMVKIFKNYSHVFKFDAQINMEKIFLQNKIVLILLPSLERSNELISFMSNLIAQNIIYTDIKLSSYSKHFQNIIFDEYQYYHSCMTKINFEKTKSNYIFSSYNYYYEKEEGMSYVINNTKTFLIMKQEDPAYSIPMKLKMDMLENMEKIPSLIYNIKHQKGFELRDMMEGEAYIFSYNQRPLNESYLNSKYQYYVEKITCEYLPASYEKSIYLPRQDVINVHILK